MSATISTALKALIEGAGLGLTGDRDIAAEGTRPPLFTVREGVSIVPDSITTPFDPAGPRKYRELAQVDLWQDWVGKVKREDPALIGALLALLDGARLTTAPTRVFGIRVRGAQRLLERKNNVVHHAITIEVVRS